MGTATPRVWKLRECSSIRPEGHRPPGVFAPLVSRVKASPAVDRLRKVYPCGEAKCLGRSGRQEPRNPAAGKKKKPTPKGGLPQPLTDTRKRWSATHPNEPGPVIIAQMFENVKPLRRTKRSGKVKGAPRQA